MVYFEYTECMQTVTKHTKKFFDNTLENAEKSAKDQVKATFESTKSQFVDDKKSSESLGFVQYTQDEMTREVIEDFYAPSNPQAQQSLAGQSLPKSGEMTQEEQAKYQKLRKELHDQVYYSKLLDRKSSQQEHVEEEQQEQEEKKMEELQLEEKKKQDDDIAIRMQTNKAEQFPGMAG